jgi:hypothetical protein
MNGEGGGKRRRLATEMQALTIKPEDKILGEDKG